MEMARDQRGHFNVIHHGSGLKGDFYLAKRDEFRAWAFKHRRQYTLGDQQIILAPPEYVIVRKLEFYREGGSEKHLRDIRSMLSISGEQIDKAAVLEWVQRRELQAHWLEAISEL